jgi:5'-3' exonuclease
MRYRLYPDYKANRDKRYDLLDAKTDYEKGIQETMRYILKNKAKRNTVRGETDEESLQRQKGIIQEILEELCIRQQEFDDVEGDDIVAYYVKNRRDNEKIVIMSSDKDMTQFISENVAIWNPRLDRLVKAEDTVKVLGVTHENVVLEKILCGDASDNIKGVKGLGEQTLVKYFPEIVENKTDLEAIVRRSKELLEERKVEKKKPLKVLENIVNGVTDGCQGDKLYEINRKIIDLSEPLLTDDARKELDGTAYEVMDTSDRNIKNVYKIVNDYRMYDMIDEGKFGNILGPYSRIIAMENRRWKEYQKK